MSDKFPADLWKTFVLPLHLRRQWPCAPFVSALTGVGSAEIATFLSVLSGIWRFVPITAAGPRQIFTGFPTLPDGGWLAERHARR